MDTLPDAFAPAQVGSSTTPANSGAKLGQVESTLSPKPVKVDGTWILITSGERGSVIALDASPRSTTRNERQQEPQANIN